MLKHNLRGFGAVLKMRPVKMRPVKMRPVIMRPVKMRPVKMQLVARRPYFRLTTTFRAYCP